MEIQEIRRLRLAQLITDNYKGSQAHFVEETGENQGEVSALLRSKSFGEKKARKIEEKCGLPSGWLDRESQESPQDKQDLDRVLPGQNSPLAVVDSTSNESIGTISLVYVTAEELGLLTHFRQATAMGKGFIVVAAETAEKDLTRLVRYQL